MTDKDRPEKDRADRDSSTPAAEAASKPSTGESVRETIDSIVVAFILAFMFRTFEAEAFVIPTGSMALTLMGAHKEGDCPKCGFRYRVSASSENPEHGETAAAVVSAACPNCRFRHEYGAELPPTYNGDRILVTKYSYELKDPERFDVAVFKNPEHAKQNYIKRVVGLPEEDVVIYHGDVYHRKHGEAEYRISRKPPEKVTTVMQTVYDNDYVLPLLHERGWPARWRSEADGNGAKWDVSADSKSFRTAGKFADEAWLRYQHVPPSERAWRTLLLRPLDPSQQAQWAKPMLVTDFCEYNTKRTRGLAAARDVDFLGLHWVGDLVLECEVEFVDPADPGAEAVLELVEGGRAFQCRIAVESGDVTLAISGVDRFRPKAAAAVRGRGPHRLRFANVDDQLLFWVDDALVAFDAPTTFQSFDAAPVTELVSGPQGDQFENRPAPIGDASGLPPLLNDVPSAQELASPAGIAARGTGLEVDHLRLLRDLYYIADKKRAGMPFAWTPNGRKELGCCDYRENVFAPFHRGGGLLPGEPETPEDVHRAFMSDVVSEPQRWKSLAAVSFSLGPDQFFMLGDNSPESLDGRLWDPDEYFVRRELLIGKALFVYWPHALSHVPGTGIPFPFFPNVERMRLIR